MQNNAIGLRGSIIHAAPARAQSRWRVDSLKTTLFPYALLAIDILTLGLLFSVVFSIYGAENFRGLYFAQALATLVAMNVFALYLIGAYHHRTDMRTLRFRSEHVITSIIVFVSAFFVLYTLVAFGKNIPISRAGTATVLASFPLLSIVYRNFLCAHLTQSRNQHSVCLVGRRASIARAHKSLRELGWEMPVTAFSINARGARQGVFAFENGNDLKEINQKEFESGHLRDGAPIEAYLISEEVDGLPRDVLRHLIHHNFNRKPVNTYDSFLQTEMRMVPNDAISAQWIFADGFRLRKSATYLRAKRLFDLTFSTISLILLAPVLGLVTIAVKLTSRGPVLFLQERTGLNEQPFTVYKFRTMHIGSENRHPFTEENDARLTPIGKLLRKTRLDELTQLWNVLIGDMSLVGPRAEWSKLVREYEESIDYYHYRHLVKPGITGWAQVNLPYGVGVKDARTKLHYDLYYVRHYSLLLDISILIKTIHTVVFAQGR